MDYFVKILKHRLTFYLILLIIIASTGIFLAAHSPHYFSSEEVNDMETSVNAFGILSPLVVLILIIISTVIPPLPLPIPLIEIVAGLAFGFLPGFLVVWISQVISSLLAFYLSRHLGKRFLGNVLNNHIWNFYKMYLHKKGPLAVFVVRLTMAAPFNIISFLAGLTQMRVVQFLIATALGTILEALVFTWVGSEFRATHIRLWYLFIAIILLGTSGSLGTVILMKFIKPTSKHSV